MNGIKVGVLTFHRCINYGSFWQAYSLVSGLKARGYNATILDHHSSRVNLAEWRCAYQPTLPTPVPATDLPLYRKKIESFFKAFKQLPLSAPFPLQQPQQMERYDVVVVGSDEVWNPFHPWFSRCPVFFGEGLQTQRLIAYAASFGNFPCSWDLDKALADKLRSFDQISVRDESSAILVKKAIATDADLVLDPCLQFDVAAEERELPWNGGFLAVYGHNFSSSFITKVQQFAKDSRLNLVSIGYRNDWANEQWIDADPHQFVHFIRNSSAVVTNFFHGCVFSLRHRKPFVCESTPYRSNKVHDLMNRAGTASRLVSEDTTAAIVAEKLQCPPADAVFERLAQLREQSNQYLNRALAAEKLKVA